LQSRPAYIADVDQVDPDIDIGRPLTGAERAGASTLGATKIR